MGLIRLNIVWSGFLQIPNRSITERVVWTLYNYDGYSRSIPGQNSPVLATIAGYAYIVDRHGDQIAFGVLRHLLGHAEDVPVPVTHYPEPHAALPVDRPGRNGLRPGGSMPQKDRWKKGTGREVGVPRSGCGRCAEIQ